MGFFNFLNQLFSKPNPEPVETMKKYLIVGLGNVGAQYVNTRHNAGFKVVEALAAKFEATFQTLKLGDVAKFNHKGRTFILLKPSTFMNLSGKAVRYWMTQENIEIENVLVVGDDLSIPFGVIRIKAKGSAGGHNGFQDIQDVLQTFEYARLRFGIGSDFFQRPTSRLCFGRLDHSRTRKTLRTHPASSRSLPFIWNGGFGNDHDRV
jgi:PTH1 family peptidyl-tRNA hydrolase